MITHRLYRNTSELPKDWDDLGAHDIFLTINFLKGLERSSPSNILTYYLCVFRDDVLVGIAVLQLTQINIGDFFRNKKANMVMQVIKQAASKFINFNLLVIGNLMHTGQHGMYFKIDHISQEQFLIELMNGINGVILEAKSKLKRNVQMVVCKDYFNDDCIHESASFFKNNYFLKVDLQPNMVFKVRNLWKTQEDYVSDFSKKYARRFRVARRKASDLKYRDLDAHYLKENSKILFRLYETVSDGASVNIFKLQEDHFYQLKSALKEKFKIVGVFLNEDLVGFYSLILNHKILETYFLGYNKAIQKKNQMYLNMLFNMVSFGINNGFKRIIFARTAMEIKSSVGAVPKTMSVYLKHTNKFIGINVLGLFIKYLNPTQKWRIRHPFKID